MLVRKRFAAVGVGLLLRRGEVFGCMCLYCVVCLLVVSCTMGMWVGLLCLLLLVSRHGGVGVVAVGVELLLLLLLLVGRHGGVVAGAVAVRLVLLLLWFSCHGPVSGCTNCNCCCCLVVLLLRARVCLSKWDGGADCGGRGTSGVGVLVSLFWCCCCCVGNCSCWCGCGPQGK